MGNRQTSSKAIETIVIELIRVESQQQPDHLGSVTPWLGVTELFPTPRDHPSHGHMIESEQASRIEVSIRPFWAPRCGAPMRYEAVGRRWHAGVMDQSTAAEAHLRRCADAVLADVPASAMGSGGRPRIWELLGPVQDAATALVAVGALEKETAQRIEDELHRALVGRGVGSPETLEAPKRWDYPPPRASSDPVQLAPRRGYACSADLRLSFGYVRLDYLVVTPEGDDPPGGSMRLVGDLTLAEPLPPPPDPMPPTYRRETVSGRAHRRRRGWTSLRPRLQRTRRRRAQGEFQGDPASSTTAHGHLTPHRSYRRRPAPPRDAGTAADHHDRSSRTSPPAPERWLRAEAEVALFDYLRGRRRHPELDLEICIDALVAVGSVGSDDDVVADVRDLLAVLGGSHPPDNLPLRWKSALASRERDEHRDASAVLAVILPSFGDVTVALEGVQIRRGNATPPLDPALRRLRLEISTETHTCSTDVDLPRSSTRPR